MAQDSNVEQRQIMETQKIFKVGDYVQWTTTKETSHGFSFHTRKGHIKAIGEHGKVAVIKNERSYHTYTVAISRLEDGKLMSPMGRALKEHMAEQRAAAQ